MKLFYLACLCLITTFQCVGQNESFENFSKDVNKDLADVNQNLDTGIESFDLESCLYNAKLAQKSITRVYNTLENENCREAADLVYEIKSEIEAALRMDEHVHGKMYLGKAKKLMNDTFYEYELCISQGPGEQVLGELEQRQALLKQQQLELEREKMEIQKKLAQQQEKESLLQKKQFIDANLSAFEETIKAYNKYLEACNCKNKVEQTIESPDKLTDKSLTDIKIHFLEKAKLVSNTYMATLDACAE